MPFSAKGASRGEGTVTEESKRGKRSEASALARNEQNKSLR